MSVQGIVRWFLPKEGHFYDYLETQASLAYDAAKAVRDLKDGAQLEQVRGAVQTLEHEGDKVAHELMRALVKTFVTPIDREDLQRLSAELDDILDRMNGAIRAASLFGVDKLTGPMEELIELLVASTLILKSSLPLLRRHEYAKLTDATNSIRKLEKDGDIIFRSAVSALFRDDAIDAKKLLREREVLNDLEKALDRCDRVGATLATLAVKLG